MIKVFKITIICVISSFVVVCLGEYLNNKEFETIVNSQILGVSATILGFTSAGIFFLLAKLSEIEAIVNIPKMFLKTKKEILDSTKYLVYSFVFLLLLLLLFPQSRDPLLLGGGWEEDGISFCEGYLNYFSLNFLRKTSILATLFTQLFVIKDLIDAIISIVKVESYQAKIKK